jgi:hypothetical protein
MHVERALEGLRNEVTAIQEELDFQYRHRQYRRKMVKAMRSLAFWLLQHTVFEGMLLIIFLLATRRLTWSAVRSRISRLWVWPLG